ncbi:hypothetical protein FQZ97_1004140 [compost metagenome]
MSARRSFTPSKRYQSTSPAARRRASRRSYSASVLFIAPCLSRPSAWYLRNEVILEPSPRPSELEHQTHADADGNAMPSTPFAAGPGSHAEREVRDKPCHSSTSIRKFIFACKPRRTRRRPGFQKMHFRHFSAGESPRIHVDPARHASAPGPLGAAGRRWP